MRVYVWYQEQTHFLWRSRSLLSRIQYFGMILIWMINWSKTWAGSRTVYYEHQSANQHFGPSHSVASKNSAARSRTGANKNPTLSFLKYLADPCGTKSLLLLSLQRWPTPCNPIPTIGLWNYQNPPGLSSPWHSLSPHPAESHASGKAILPLTAEILQQDLQKTTAQPSGSH